MSEMRHRWSRLRDLVESDRRLMVQLALLDLDNPKERVVAEQSPEYFFSGDEEEPVPFSILRALAMHCATVGKARAFSPSSRRRSKTSGDQFMIYSLHFSLLGLENLEWIPFDENLLQGAEVEHEGRQMIVFECDEGKGRLYLVPRSRVDPSC